MHRNPENAQESRKCMGIPIFLKKEMIFFVSCFRFFWFCFRPFVCFSVFLYNQNAREYRKFGNPEREYRIPEIPVPGKFGNTEFPKYSHSRTSVFPKENNSGMAPP